MCGENGVGSDLVRAARLAPAAPDSGEALQGDGRSPRAARRGRGGQPTQHGSDWGSEPPRVTLLAPGAEPRKALRIVVPSTLKSHMDMEMAMAMAMNVGGQEIPATTLPAMRIGADMAVTNVAASGDVTYTMSFTGVGLASSAGVDPAVASAIEAMSGELKTISGTATVSNRGINRQVKIDTSKATNPQFTQMMDSVTNSLNGVSSRRRTCRARGVADETSSMVAVRSIGSRRRVRTTSAARRRDQCVRSAAGCLGILANTDGRLAFGSAGAGAGPASRALRCALSWYIRWSAVESSVS